MARLFTSNPPEPEPKIIVKKRYNNFRLVVLFVIVPLVIILVFIEIVKKREIDKDKKMNELIELLEMDNGSILTQKVKYETFQKIDPDDTSDMFFEVVNAGKSKYKNGDLIKYSHRFFNEQGIEAKKYCVIKEDQIDFHIKKENVKESLLKRK